MFHFYSLALFLIGLISVSIGKGYTNPESDANMAFFVFQIIFLAAFSINFLIFFFSNLEAQREFKSKINRIRTLKKQEALKKEKFEFLKNYYEQYLMKLYPEHEKDIFDKIVNSRPKELVELFEEYPELKSSVVIKKLSKNLKEEMDNLYRSKLSVEDEIEELQNLKTNPWFINIPEIPQDLKS